MCALRGTFPPPPNSCIIVCLRDPTIPPHLVQELHPSLDIIHWLCLLDFNEDRVARMWNTNNSTLEWSVCIDDVAQFLLLSNISPHRGPLWAFFGFASRGGVVRTTDGLCRPDCHPAVPHGERGAAFSTESPTFCRILGLLGLGAEHEPALHRTCCALASSPLFFTQSKGLVLCLSRTGCLAAEESFGSE